MNAHTTIQSLNSRCKIIMDIIQSLGPISKNEILIKTKMKLTTLNRDMTTLLEKKIIIESALADSTGGRKAALYDVNPIDFYLVGIDVSRTYSQIVVTNLKFEIIIEKRIQDDLYDMNRVILSLPKELSSILEVGAIAMSSIIGIGIGLVHDVDSYLLKENMQKEIGVPVSIDNGANTAVIGEYYLGLGKGKHNIAFINCGVGIRTGVIFLGNLIRTINHDKDALAHMIVEQNGNLCECGNHGCLETYVSINDLPMKYKQMMLSQTEGSFNDINKDLSYLDVCNLAESNNVIAKQIILQAAFCFGIALTNFIRLLTPQLVILSGPYIQNSPLFYEETKRIVLANLSTSLNDIEFSKGGYFESNSIAMGASVIAMRGIIEK